MGKVTWSKQKEDLLKEKYSSTSNLELSVLLEKSPGQIRTRACILGLTKSREAKDTNIDKKRQLDEQYIVELYLANKDLGYAEICKQTGVCKSTLKRLLRERQITVPIIPSYRAWTDKDVDILKQFFKVKSLEELSLLLDRPRDAIATKASKLGLTNKTGPTQIERVVESVLVDLGFDFETQPSVTRSKKQVYRPDFRIRNTQILIEVFGDYFHCNPNRFTDTSLLTKVQLANLKRDEDKLEWYRENGYTVHIIWESDLTDLDKVKSQLVLLK